MPIPRGARVRVVTTKTGKRIRFTFVGKKKVIEAKNIGKKKKRSKGKK